MDAYRYWAFISYSHSDEAWAKWLHKAIETYGIPARLLRHNTPVGPAPRRFFPIFRDRDELPSSPELGGVIRDALAASRWLIVICSPNSARSRWVDEEVRHFKSLNRGNRVLALIVDGEPHSEPAIECFCPALKVQVAAGKTLTDDPAEPIAADARAGKDHRRGALLKLLAGMLGVGYDELVQRDRHQRRIQLAQRLALASLVLAALIGVWRWGEQRRADEARRVYIERLVEAGRDELSRNQHSRAAVLLGRAYAEGEQGPALRFLLRQALRPLDALSPTVHLPVRSDVGALAPDGETLLLVSPESAQLWSWRSGNSKSLEGSDMFAADSEFSADGRRVLAEHKRRAAMPEAVTAVWDRASGKRLALLAGHSGSATSGTAFYTGNPDMSEVVLLDDEGHAAVWSVDSGKRRLVLPLESVLSASFSADGRWLVAGSNTGEVLIADAATGKPRSRFSVAPGAPVQAFLDAKNELLYTASVLGKLAVRNPETGVLIDALGGHGSPILLASFAQDGRLLVTGGLDDGFKVWDLATGAQKFAGANTRETNLTSLSVSADGRYVLSGFVDGFGLWDVEEQRLMYRLDGHAAYVSLQALTPDGHLISSGYDEVTRVWDVKSLRGNPVMQLRHGEPVGGLPGTRMARYSADGQRVISAGADGVAKVWDSTTGALLHALEAHKKPVSDVVFGPDGTHALTVAGDGLRLWRLDTGLLVPGFDAPGPAFRAEFSPDGQRLLVRQSRTSAAKLALVLDAATGKLLHSLSHEAVLSAAALNPDAGNSVMAATGDANGVVKLWGQDGALRQTLTAHGKAINDTVFSPDGRRLATLGNDSVVRVWQLRTEDGLAEPVAQLSVADVDGLFRAAFSRDGSRLVFGATPGAFVWRIGAAQALELSGPTAQVTSISFSPDEALVVASSFDGAARVWDAERGRLLASFAVVPDMYSVFMRPDGKQLVTANDGPLRAAELWDVGYETRSAETILRWLDCTAPWKLSNLKLIRKKPTLAACNTAPGTQ